MKLKAKKGKRFYIPGELITSEQEFEVGEERGMELLSANLAEEVKRPQTQSRDMTAEQPAVSNYGTRNMQTRRETQAQKS